MPPTRPTVAALAIEPTPRTIVQKMTGPIIILMRETKPSPSGLRDLPNSGKNRPTAAPSTTEAITAMYSQWVRSFFVAGAGGAEVSAGGVCAIGRSVLCGGGAPPSGPQRRGRDVTTLAAPGGVGHDCGHSGHGGRRTAGSWGWTGASPARGRRGMRHPWSIARRIAVVHVALVAAIALFSV
ncbi:hypothetical protein MICRO116_410027 [Micrococcus sp. 116]|nr:hypothetical protein MICRO116_410027 [Micrococcus sp. 116]